MKYMPAIDSDRSDPLRHLSVYAAEVALRSLVNDVKSLVKDAVLQELTPIIDEGGLDAATAKSRKKALMRWFKSDNPLSLDQHAHPALIEAVVKPVDGVMALKATRPSSISLAKFVEDVLSHCKASNPRSKPPFIPGGQFFHVARVAIREVSLFAARQASSTDADLELVIRDGFVTACHTLKINHVPWSAPPIPGRRGAPPSRVVHDVWMGLGAKNPTGPPTSVVIRAYENTPAAIARRTSQNIVASDGRGEWSAIEVSLKSFHTILHKLVPPREITEATFDGAGMETYITEAYTFAVDMFNPSKPIHLLALVAGIVCAGLLPNVFADKEELKSKPHSSSAHSTFIRNLDWVSRESRSRGVKDTQVFLRSVTLYIINMYESNSPIMTRQSEKLSNKKWVNRNSKPER